MVLELVESELCHLHTSGSDHHIASERQERLGAPGVDKEEGSSRVGESGMHLQEGEHCVDGNGITGGYHLLYRVKCSGGTLSFKCPVIVRITIVLAITLILASIDSNLRDDSIHYRISSNGPGLTELEAIQCALLLLVTQ